MKYFVASSSYSVIARTMKEAIPINLKIMLGILPIYVGYVLMAVSCFWNDQNNFSNFPDTMYTFFCMMNGDSIVNTFGYVSRKNQIFGQLMIYTWVFASICVIQNMNTVVVEDCYLNCKYKSDYDWLIN